MITFKVELFGALKSPFGRCFELSVKQGTTIGDLLKNELKYREKDTRYLVFIVNTKTTSINRNLEDKDELKILLPIGGG